MYLDVTFKDGTVSHCVLTASHTIQIVNPQSQIQDAFSLDGVESVALNVAGNPAATDPTPPDLSGAAEGATVTEITTGTSDGALGLSQLEPASAPNADVTISNLTTSDPTQADASASDTTSDSSEQASSDPAQSDASTSETGSAGTSEASTSAVTPADDHAIAAADAAVTVAAVQAVVNADTLDGQPISAADKQAQIQTALADVELALTQWPDSAPLLDAKAQLEALAGEITA